MKTKLCLVPHLTLDDHQEPAQAQVSGLSPAVLATSPAGPPSFPSSFHTQMLCQAERLVEELSGSVTTSYLVCDRGQVT